MSPCSADIAAHTQADTFWPLWVEVTRMALSPLNARPNERSVWIFTPNSSTYILSAPTASALRIHSAYCFRAANVSGAFRWAGLSRFNLRVQLFCQVKFKVFKCWRKNSCVEIEFPVLKLKFRKAACWNQNSAMLKLKFRLMNSIDKRYNSENFV